MSQYSYSGNRFERGFEKIAKLPDFGNANMCVQACGRDACQEVSGRCQPTRENMFSHAHMLDTHACSHAYSHARACTFTRSLSPSL